MTQKPSQQNAFEKVFCHALSQESIDFFAEL